MKLSLKKRQKQENCSELLLWKCQALLASKFRLKGTISWPVTCLGWQLLGLRPFPATPRERLL